jgi:hypothetical protein
MWMWALRKVPWRTLLRHTPTIVEAARTYYTASARKTAPDPERPTAGGIDGLRRTVERLEERELQQAAIVADLARELAALAAAVEVLSVRLTLALWAAGIAGLLALVSLVVALVRD